MNTGFVKVLLGETPASFFVEAALRMLFLYLVLLVAMRIMGRRMSSQLNRNELLALVSLAAAIGPALQDPERGLVAPLVIAALVAVLQRTIARLTCVNRRWDELANGRAEILLVDGRLQLAALQRNAISQERLFAELRANGIIQLGAVARVYIETNGALSVVAASDIKPGLSIVPECDRALAEEIDYDARQTSCTRCGATEPAGRERHRCDICHADAWSTSVAA